jgi:two-component system, chemotaxis family, protein-glutamate methylesterase/glutaminase
VVEKAAIRVLVCDDSLVAREMLTEILGSDAEIQVVGVCRDGQDAVAKAAELAPDLVTMDIHMPGLDGVRATEQIMAYTPTPILVVSSSVHGEGVGRAFDALEAGALEVMRKPEPAEWADMARIGRRMIRTVKILARVQVVRHPKGRRVARVAGGEVGAGGARKRGPGISLVAIGSSTGGPTALSSVLGALPAKLPVPVVVAQHIAEGFVPGLVEWLAGACSIVVRAAEDGEELAPGYAYFAPTGANLVVRGSAVHFAERAPRQLYVPSADDLFASVAAEHGHHAVGVLLTGMGTDGAKGLKALRETGATTIAQDEASSVVWGMPRAAVEAGAASEVLPVSAIGPRVAAIVGSGR